MRTYQKYLDNNKKYILQKYYTGKGEFNVLIS